MSKPNSNDPADTIRAWISRLETSVDQVANQVMGTSQFSSTMNQANQIQLTVQKLFAEMMGHQLSMFNMPSREDVVRLGEALRSIESRLSRIENRLESLGPKQASDTNASDLSKRPPGQSVPERKLQMPPLKSMAQQKKGRPHEHCSTTTTNQTGAVERYRRRLGQAHSRNGRPDHSTQHQGL